MFLHCIMYFKIVYILFTTSLKISIRVCDMNYLTHHASFTLSTLRLHDKKRRLDSSFLLSAKITHRMHKNVTPKGKAMSLTIVIKRAVVQFSAFYLLGLHCIPSRYHECLNISDFYFDTVTKSSV